MCDRLGTAFCTQLDSRNARFEAPPGGQYGGWHEYVWKDLRAMLGQKVAGAYHLRYCGKGKVSTCARELWAALDGAGKRLAAQQGPDPSAWRAPEAQEDLTLRPWPADHHAVHEQAQRHPSGDGVWAIRRIRRRRRP